MSRNDHWNTPEWIVSLIHGGYPLVGLDPCSNGTSIVGARVNLSSRGLTEDWLDLARGGLVFVNPPYSGPGPWLQKCSEEAWRGCRVLALIKADPATRAWDHVWANCTAIGFPRSRLMYLSPDRHKRTFKASKKKPAGANFPSALVLWGHDLDSVPLLRDEQKLRWVRPWPRCHLAVQEGA